MKAKQLHDAMGLRTYMVALATGEEASEELLGFADEHRLSAAELTAVGAFSRVTLGWFDPDEAEYRSIEVDEQVEVLSLTGNIAATEEGERQVHAHLVVGKEDGTTMGGHLLSAVVRPTLEVIVTESQAHLQRTVDPETGLPLLPR